MEDQAGWELGVSVASAVYVLKRFASAGFELQHKFTDKTLVVL